MTAIDITFRYGNVPTESETRAIDGAREVYGIRNIRFDEKERSVKVEYDATRLSAETVAGLLRRAGLDLREQLHAS